MNRHAESRLPARVAHPSLCPWILLGLSVLAAVVLIRLVDPRQLAWPTCAFFRITGLYCPGCGATRATHQLLHGELVSALRYNALWVLALPSAFCCVVWRMCSPTGWRRLLGNLVRNRWVWVGALTVPVLFGLLRNVPVYPLLLLAPPG